MLQTQGKTNTDIGLYSVHVKQFVIIMYSSLMMSLFLLCSIFSF